MKEFQKSNYNIRRIIFCNKCNQKKEHHAKGMCFNCYRKYAWNKPKIICKNCGKERHHKAKGMCGSCHMKIFHYDKIKKYNCRKNHDLGLEEYKKLTKECVICGFNKIVELHHIDRNHKNKDTKNLVGLCPNHHKMLHDQRYSKDIYEILKRKIS